MFVCCIGTRVTIAQTAPSLKTAASRKVQGGKTYDIALPLNGAGSGIECRGGDKLAIVLSFDQPIASANIALTAGQATISGTPLISGATITVNLTGVGNAQELKLTATNIASAAGGAFGSATVAVRVLDGDINSDGVVDEADLGIVKARGAGNTSVDGFNFRSDENVSGSISGADVTRVKSRLGTSVAANRAATINTAPVVGNIDEQRIFSGVASRNVAFAVSDNESAAASIAVAATSDNQSVLPDSGINISGDGATRIISFTPTKQSGVAHITISASDGLISATETVTVNVTGQPTLYLAIMTPQSGVNSTGSGFATLQLSADETFAILNFQYSNLTTPEVAEHVHGPAGPTQTAGILFDIDTASINPDGSRTWTFVPVGQNTVADQINALKQGNTYINVHTSKYPAGEIRGQFLLSTGSQTFTPPAPPPPLPSGPPTQSDAIRFLQQATFGPNDQTIAQVQSMGFDAWLNQQFQMPPTLVSPVLQQRIALGESASRDDLWVEGWWNASLTAPDQLRQRVAFALSEIVVVSQTGAGLTERPTAIANYYDMLLNDAFRNYRTILEDVTLNPEMGVFLNMRGNLKANAATGTNPNENYAREVLQLFSIGLNKLQPDGTLKLDATGLPIPTYDQSVVQGLARVFTGWNWHQNGTSNNPAADYVNAMTLVAANHETGTKQLLDGVVLPANQTGQKDLADLLNQIFNHPNIGPFVCRQLIQRLVTDNPSPAYVYRVAQKFANNGNGVRGDMQAVVRAILTDYEARSVDVINNQGYGHLREPVVRTAHVIRAFHPKSNSYYWKIPQTDSELGQSALRAPTVFNFFEPAYVYPGQLAVAGLVAPEFQITTDTTSIASSNFLESGIRAGFKGGDIFLNINTERAIASNASALVDRVNMLLMANQMPTDMHDRIMTYLNTIPIDGSGTDTITRAQSAIHLVATSPQFSVQK